MSVRIDMPANAASERQRSHHACSSLRAMSIVEYSGKLNRAHSFAFSLSRAAQPRRYLPLPAARPTPSCAIPELRILRRNDLLQTFMPLVIFATFQAIFQAVCVLFSSARCLHCCVYYRVPNVSNLAAKHINANPRVAWLSSRRGPHGILHCLSWLRMHSPIVVEKPANCAS